MNRGPALAERLSHDVGRRLVFESQWGAYTATVTGVRHHHGGYHHYVVEWSPEAPPYWWPDPDMVNPSAAVWASGEMKWLEDQ